MANENEKINLIETLNKDIADLYMSSKFSDVFFVVENHKIPSHRSIICSRCEYFEKLFSNDLNLPYRNEFKLEAPLQAFEILLKYFYTGEINLSEITDIEILIQVVDLVEKYLLFYLKEYFEKYFIQILSLENVCRLIEIAKIYKLTELEKKSFYFIEMNSDKLLESESFRNISEELLKEILSRDSFCASSELCIFNAVNDWSKEKNRNIENVIHLVNLILIPSGELSKIRNSGTLNLEKIFNMIDKQTAGKLLKRSGIQEPNQNFITSKYNSHTIVVQSQSFKRKKIDISNDSTSVRDISNDSKIIFFSFTNRDISNDSTSVDVKEDEFVRHLISSSNNSTKINNGIIVELGSMCNVNHLKMLLFGESCYSYFIEISTDNKKWERIIDYSSYTCRSWQNLYFPTKSMKYIKIVGTRKFSLETVTYFTIVTLEAYYRENIPEIKDGFVVPNKNVALVDMGAVVEADNHYPSKNALINGDPKTGYAASRYGRCPIVIKLSQPYYIGSMGLSFERNNYIFYIQISTNMNDWETVLNKKSEFSKYGPDGLISFSFTPKLVLYIKIVGIESSGNDLQMYIRHFECPCEIEELKQIEKFQ